MESEQKSLSCQPNWICMKSFDCFVITLRESPILELITGAIKKWVSQEGNLEPTELFHLFILICQPPLLPKTNKKNKTILSGKEAQIEKWSVFTWRQTFCFQSGSLVQSGNYSNFLAEVALSWVKWPSGSHWWSHLLCDDPTLCSGICCKVSWDRLYMTM